MNYDASQPPESIVYDLIVKFLARAHPFTAVGLQSEAFAYSLGKRNAINYLAFLPQRNGEDWVESRGSPPDPKIFFFASLMAWIQVPTHQNHCINVVAG